MQNDTAARTTAIATAGIVLVLAFLGVFGNVVRQPTAQAAAPTQPPIILIATAVPVASLPPHLVVAYAAPDGVVLGPMDLTLEEVAPVGRLGSDWAQVQRGDGTRVWIRVGELTVELQSIAAAQPDVGMTVMSVPPVQAPQAFAPAPIPPVDAISTPRSPIINAALNDPNQNGGNIAPPDCPFPIVNGVCGDGQLAQASSEEGVKVDTRPHGGEHAAVPHLP